MNFLPTDLTLEQQFELRLMEESTVNINREQALALLMQASRLLMLKDNVIRELIKQVVEGEKLDFQILPNSG